MTASLLIVFFLGAVLGIAIGLVGSGSVLAVPLLIYGAGLDIHSAVCVSMLTVTLLGTIGTIEKFRQINFRAAIVIAVFGVIFAPLGAFLNQQSDHRVLVVLFAVVALATSIRMLMHRDGDVPFQNQYTHNAPLLVPITGQSALAGAAIGLIGGLLGISGGFIAVPVLASYQKLEIHRAVATSWTIVAVVSASATIAHLLAGQGIPLGDTLLFIIAGVIGFEVSSRTAHQFSGPGLTRLFAAALIIVSIAMLAGISRL